jgi:hypothetical protein
MSFVKVLYIQPKIEEKGTTAILEEATSNHERPCSFTVVRNAFSALEYLQTATYDVIIVYEHMQNMKGSNFQKIIEQLGYKIPVIVMEKKYSSEVKPDILYVPFTYRQLRNAIESKLVKSIVEMESPEITTKDSPENCSNVSHSSVSNSFFRLETLREKPPSNSSFSSFGLSTTSKSKTADFSLVDNSGSLFVLPKKQPTKKRSFLSRGGRRAPTRQSARKKCKKAFLFDSIPEDQLLLPGSDEEYYSMEVILEEEEGREEEGGGGGSSNDKDHESTSEFSGRLYDDEESIELMSIGDLSVNENEASLREWKLTLLATVADETLKRMFPV